MNNEIELKSKDKNFFYYSTERKTHDRNTCNNMKPSNQKKHNDFTGEPNWEKQICCFALIHMRKRNNYNVLLQL